MKKINRKELIELIELIPSRSVEEKPILIYQAYHSGSELFAELAWPRQYSRTSEILLEHNNYWTSDQCKFLEAYMIHFNKELAAQCVEWQKKYQKPAVVLLEKYVNWFDEKGCPSLSGFGELKTLTLLEKVGIDAFGFITERFDVYEYTEDEELEWHPVAGNLSRIDDEQRKDLAKKYGITIHE